MLVDQARPHGFPRHTRSRERGDSHPLIILRVQSAPRAGRARGSAPRGLSPPVSPASPKSASGPAAEPHPLPRSPTLGRRGTISERQPDGARQPSPTSPEPIPTAAGRPNARARPGLRRRAAPWRPPRSPLTLVTARHGTTRGDTTRRGATRPRQQIRAGRTEGAGVWQDTAGRAAAAKGTRSPRDSPGGGDHTDTPALPGPTPRVAQSDQDEIPGSRVGGWEGEEGKREGRRGLANRNQASAQRTTQESALESVLSNAGGLSKADRQSPEARKERMKTANPIEAEREIDLGTDRDKAQRQQTGAWGKRTRGRS